jgi:hypothetical protein
MKKGPGLDGPSPFLLRDAAYCLVVAAASLEAEGWLEDAMPWFVEAELAGWLAEALDAGWLVEAVDAGWFTEAEDDGWLAEAEDDGWLAEADDGLDDCEEPAMFRPGMSAFACFAWSMAAWVRGPMMPSTGPGLKPLSFSACCSCFTDSSPAILPPLMLLSEAEAPLVELAEGWLVEAEAEAAGWFVEAEAEAAGWFVEAEADAAGWFVEAEVVAAGWLADAEVAAGLFSPAIAEPAAISAATRASFLNSMVVFLSSYTERKTRANRRAVHFGAWAARKLQAPAAPSDARHLGARYRGIAT